MIATEVPSFAASPNSETPSSEAVVVSGTSPLADGFRSRFFTEDDYRRFHARAAPNTDAVLEAIGRNARYWRDWYVKYIVAEQAGTELPN